MLASKNVRAAQRSLSPFMAAAILAVVIVSSETPIQIHVDAFAGTKPWTQPTFVFKSSLQSQMTASSSVSSASSVDCSSTQSGERSPSSSQSYLSDIRLSSVDTSSHSVIPKYQPSIKEAVDSFELVVGRLAMIGALCLLCKEVFTGESFLDQMGETLARAAVAIG
jgi:hypothetical protein